ncbi:hypothetical protein HYPSUDRAFT_208963 [Hypholoma sublateritium FD-334 SS-4]|uniref:Uncharacterized protein n=1 Tax=Hypholoma sublateritium (strain FD-334 SS-4) TaxID=945553 RepID=A0A0D2KHX3_HYPSF|nr:hypothetical protein HYPSUDRAFT_208963 [Hypholoma sublateritium FD-334 SS-4]
MDSGTPSLDGGLSTSFAVDYLHMGGRQASAVQSSAPRSIGEYGRRQMPWSSSGSTESSWSHGSGRNDTVSSNQYHQLHARFNESQQENVMLLTKNAALEAKVETLMMAYNMLLTHIPAATTPTCRPSLHKEDYPNIRFWTRQDWNAATQEQILEIDAPEEAETFPDFDEEDGGSKDPSPGPANVRAAAKKLKAMPESDNGLHAQLPIDAIPTIPAINIIPGTPLRPQPMLAHEGLRAPTLSEPPMVPYHNVNFTFYALDPIFRRSEIPSHSTPENLSISMLFAGTRHHFLSLSSGKTSQKQLWASKLTPPFDISQ